VTRSSPRYFRERFGFKPGAFPVAARIGDATLSLPFYPNIPGEHVIASIVDCLKRLMTNAG
jgi:dTDP-4-amino-4,6-dideoxygalactose transaminase